MPRSTAAFVEQGARRRSPRSEQARSCTEAVARYLFKLMAYKDEYEVARLHTDRRFTDKIAAQFEGDYKLVHHLAPPLLGKTNSQGEPVKQAFGPWMRSAFGVLARLKGLRGGPLDIFGKTEERRSERALIGEYRDTVDELLRHAERRQPGPGRGDRPPARRHPRLRPRQGPPPGRGAAEVGGADGSSGGSRRSRQAA